MLATIRIAPRGRRWLLPLLACFGLLAQVSARPDGPDEPGTGELRIEIVNEAGEGIGKVHLSLASIPSDGPAPPQGSTDAEGRLTLTVDAGVDRRILVRPRERGSRENVDCRALEPGEVRDVRIALRTQPDLVVRRKLVWSGTGDPVQAVGVTVFTEFQDYIPGQSADVQPGTDGVFTAEIKSWENTYAIVFGEGISPQGVLLNSLTEETPEAPIEIEDAASIVGTVQGSSVEGLVAIVSTPNLELPFAGRTQGFDFGVGSKRLEYRAQVQPRSGRFDLLDLPAGVPLHLRIVSEKDTVYQRGSFFEIGSGETKQAMIEMDGGLAIRGTLVDEAGNPVADQVIALGEGGPPGRVLHDWQVGDLQDRTDSSGRFELKGLAAGTWNVGPVSGEESAGIGLTQSVELEGSDVVVALTLYEPRYVSGVVTLVGGEPAGDMVKSCGSNLTEATRRPWCRP